MILVILAVSIIFIVAGVLIFNKCYDDCFEFLGGFLITVGGIGGILSVIVLPILALNASNLAVIDKKIAMYEEENAKIESQLAETVAQYQQYEKDIFTEVSPETSVQLVSMYPELKSDTLVQKQIETYVSNNNTIKELKAEKIDGKVIRWWLYFGG